MQAIKKITVALVNPNETRVVQQPLYPFSLKGNEVKEVVLTAVVAQLIDKKILKAVPAEPNQ